MQHAQSHVTPEPQQAGPTLVASLISHQNAFKAYVRRAVQQEADVEDIFQKLLLRALRKEDGHLIENPQAYGYKMLQHLIIDHGRELQKKPECLEAEPECDSIELDALLEHEQRVALYQQVIQAMPPLRREVFVRRRLHGESRKDIADALDMAEEAVKKHINRAMDDLRVAVEKHYSIKYCPLSDV